MKLSTKLSVDRFSVDQLVLRVSESVDPSKLDLGDYEEFIEAATQNRAFQQEAVGAAVRFLIGGEYGSTADLARQSWEASADLQRRYPTAEALVERLPFPDKLACSLDLATGTGKSYVYHAIARILLNEGSVDRVLLLCPSLTIEQGLTSKFGALLADGDLTDLLPERDGVAMPEVVDAGSTVKEGQLCIENIHATYARTGSAIEDSFAGQGERTLVLSDEAHHVHSPSESKLKLWKRFVEDPQYGFRYHVGGSGTCYVKNEYFADVVSRYPIRQAIDEGWVKAVFYLDKDSSTTDEERFQKLRAQHEKNRTRNKPLKPLTIAVTQSIKAAEELAERLVDFLAEHVGGREQAAAQVLVVTSADRHKANVTKLGSVDAADSPVEWIISVAMLSEGWDVQNVFQIYPHEKRAFNSKLLVSQVLGRGLRRPAGAGAQPVVHVFNHEKWGPEIEELVAEVLDVETTISQRPAERSLVDHFELDQLVYEDLPTGIEAAAVEAPVDIEKINLKPQSDHDETTVFVSATDAAKVDKLTTRVVDRRYPVAEVVADVRRRMRDHDKATDGTLAATYPKKRVEELIVGALKRLKLEGEVSQENRQLILSAFGSLRRRTTRAGAELTRQAVDLETVSTADIRVVTSRVSGLTSHLGVFHDSESPKLGTPEDAAALKKAEQISVPTWLRKVPNTYLFKSPVNVVLTSYRPEFQFVERLFEEGNAKALGRWIKSPDVGFYKIQFAFKKSPTSKRKVAEFNPDFFLVTAEADRILVVETKMDGDASPLNIGKRAAAIEHFKIVNEMLEKRGQDLRYRFHMLGPEDYDSFFGALREGKLDHYVSGLEGALS